MEKINEIISTKAGGIDSAIRLTYIAINYLLIKHQLTSLHARY